MKLSVSAYRAHASAHKKILDTAYQLNYGSTQASSASTAHQHFKLEPLQIDEIPASTGNIQHQLHEHQQQQHLGGATGDNSASDTPAASPQSLLNTSHEEDDLSSNDCRSPSQRCAASDSGESSRSGKVSRGNGGGGGAGGGSLQSVAEATGKAATQSWRNIRAVMAYYHSLRKIKRNKSNQRWMKLRTTVQISSAIQKKPPLKREDSFLKRFSTRQIPDTQETVEDTGSEGGGTTQPVSRRRRRLQKHPRSVVNPDENFYFYWLLTLTVCVLYNLWTLIVRQSFPEFQNMATNAWMFCDGISDLVFLLDIVVQLRTGYLEQGLMVYDSKKLAGHYLHSRAFLLDLGSLCPLDLLQMRFGFQPMLRFPRFLKVYRAVNYYYMVESRTVWPNLWRVVNLIHILLILAHWFGCFYFLLSEAEGFQGDWVYPYRPGDYATLTRKYLGSLYWSTLTLTTIGDLPTPETNAEQPETVDGPKSLPRRGVKSRLLQFNSDHGYVFTIVSYLIGVFIFATIVGQVGNVITNRNANRLEFERLLDGAKMYMRHHKVPSGMKKRVLRWYDYSWSRGRIQGGGDINTALGLLPDKLKTELALHVNLSVLKKVTIFQECQPEFLHDLVLKMKAYIFTPGDSICRKGEVAREMFIIADGILEVISETGRVLTTMKAGDFFGEIGILNLDGLNKRTADVRSVGYSELFSLSREDVLAAMKDYPEAQEILQALGRKRLMEVRNSARHPHGINKYQRSQATGDHLESQMSPEQNRTLISKIKSEAKGLKNVLRKSRIRRSDESIELQPLHTHTTSSIATKHILKRMPRVKSDELSQEEVQETIGVTGNEQSNLSPLGAGLPLLSRLRLLKEKQDNEERGEVTSPSNILSPSSVQENQNENVPEVIGAGLPLLQRLLLLKAKEERASTAATNRSRSNSPSPALSPKPFLGKVSFRDRLFSVRSSTGCTSPAAATAAAAAPSADSPNNFPVQLTPNSPPLEKLPSASTPDVVRDTRDSTSTPLDSESESQPLLDCSAVAAGSDSADPWSKLKQAAILRDNSTTYYSDQTSTSDNNNKFVSNSLTNTTNTSASASASASVSEPNNRTKPSLLKLQSRTKHYESIDDLSPEYCGLPFVKKLKILNERQKLAELESAMKTRSVSLDIPDSQQPYDDSTLTRSLSEASAMHRKNNHIATHLTVSNIGPPTSPESNETPERKNLKSILKKLSENQRPSTLEHSTTSDTNNLRCESSSSRSSERDLTMMRQLMRAPTVEGYAARHSKLAKSVTFDRDTLSSASTPSNDVFTVAAAAADTTLSLDVFTDKIQPEDSDRLCLDDFRHKTNIKINENQNTKVNEKQEFFESALTAIKQVISTHIEDIQIKFQQQFDRLEQEVRSKDAIINRLKQHIYELEHNFDEDCTTASDSIETVINRSREDVLLQEYSEIEEIPEESVAEYSWNSHPSSDTILELDSATDTESDAETADTPTTFLHNDNWELEMLAAQMRQQRRSASFDHVHTGARRRVLCRGFSADTSTRD